MLPLASLAGWSHKNKPNVMLLLTHFDNMTTVNIGFIVNQ